MTLGEELQEKLAIEPIWNIPLGNIDIPITKGVVADLGCYGVSCHRIDYLHEKHEDNPGEKAGRCRAGDRQAVRRVLQYPRRKRKAIYSLSADGSAVSGRIQYARAHRSRSADEGAEHHRRSGDHEYRTDSICGDSSARRQRVAETFRSSDGHYAADEHFRAVHQTAVTMYATFRQHSGRIHYHGTDHILHSGSRAAGIQFLFRYLRRTAAGICILFPDISVHSGSG